MNGKGSTPRPVDGEKYRRNYDAIFRKITLRIRERDENGKLVFANVTLIPSGFLGHFAQ